MEERPSRSAPPLLPTLVSEFKRRGVWRAGSLYVMAAWVAIQAMGPLSDAFLLPRQATQLLILLAIAGFPVVVLVAWLYRFGVGIESEQAPEGFALTRAQLRWSLGVMMLFGLAVLTTTGLLAMREPVREPESLPAIAVLPFRAAGLEPTQSYLATSLSSALATHLRSADLVVRDEVLAARVAEGVPYDSVIRALELDFLVTGEVLAADGRVRVTVWVLDALQRRLVENVRVEQPGADLFALLDALTSEVGERLQAKLGHAQRLARWQAGTRSRAAYELVLRAEDARLRAAVLESANDAAGRELALLRADSLLARAVALDRRYAEALIERADVRRVLALHHFLLNRREKVDSTLYDAEILAARACDAAPRNARAYEMRGLVRQLRATFAVNPDSLVQERLRRRARGDLERAVALDPRLVRAHRALGDLYGSAGDFVGAIASLQEAYELDTYQQEAPALLISLFTYHFELGNDSSAAQYCAELQRRGRPFPRALCSLQLAAWSRSPHRIPADSAWIIAESAREAGLEYVRNGPTLHMAVAAVLARAGLADSARAVLVRARAAGRNDPDLLHEEAGVRVLLHEYDRASALLREYARYTPSPLMAQSRRISMLRDNPLAPRRAD